MDKYYCPDCKAEREWVSIICDNCESTADAVFMPVPPRTTPTAIVNAAGPETQAEKATWASIIRGIGWFAFWFCALLAGTDLFVMARKWQAIEKTEIAILAVSAAIAVFLFVRLRMTRKRKPPKVTPTSDNGDSIVGPMLGALGGLGTMASAIFFNRPYGEWAFITGLVIIFASTVWLVKRLIQGGRKTPTPHRNNRAAPQPAEERFDWDAPMASRNETAFTHAPIVPRQKYNGALETTVAPVRLSVTTRQGNEPGHYRMRIVTTDEAGNGVNVVVIFRPRLGETCQVNNQEVTDSGAEFAVCNGDSVFTVSFNQPWLRADVIATFNGVTLPLSEDVKLKGIGTEPNPATKPPITAPAEELYTWRFANQEYPTGRVAFASTAIFVLLVSLASVIAQASTTSKIIVLGIFIVALSAVLVASKIMKTNLLYRAWDYCCLASNNNWAGSMLLITFMSLVLIFCGHMGSSSLFGGNSSSSESPTASLWNPAYGAPVVLDLGEKANAETQEIAPQYSWYPFWLRILISLILIPTTLGYCLWAAREELVGLIEFADAGGSATTESIFAFVQKLVRNERAGNRIKDAPWYEHFSADNPIIAYMIGLVVEWTASLAGIRA